MHGKDRSHDDRLEDVVDLSSPQKKKRYMVKTTPETAEKKEEKKPDKLAAAAEEKKSDELALAESMVAGAVVAPTAWKKLNADKKKKEALKKVKAKQKAKGKQEAKKGPKMKPKKKKKKKNAPKKEPKAPNAESQGAHDDKVALAHMNSSEYLDYHEWYRFYNAHLRLQWTLNQQRCRQAIDPNLLWQWKKHDEASHTHTLAQSTCP